MVPRERCLPLVEVLCVALVEVRVGCPLSGVKDELANGHAGIDLHRPSIDIAHFERDRTPEAGIDPATGLVERNAKPGNARLSLNGCYDIVRELDTFEGPGEYECSGFDHELVSLCLLNAGSYCLLFVRVDDLVRWFVPDKMVAEPDIDGIWLDQFFIVGIDFDMAPFDAVEELPVNENHWQ